MNFKLSMKVVLLCPSLFRPCGIASYSQYVVDSLRRRGMDAVCTATIHEAYSECSAPSNTLIIQHEYGLYDRFAHAHESPTASELIVLTERLLNSNKSNRVAVVMHTYHPRDHVYSCINRQLLSSSVPLYHLNSVGAALHGINYLEHGVYQAETRRQWSIGVAAKRSANFTLGTFGFLSPNKNVRGLVDKLAGTGVSLVANFATNNLAYADEIRQYASSRDVKLTLTTDFLTEPAILERLRSVDACISMQDSIGHYATSGSIRFLMNLRVPIICTDLARQFSDLGSSVLRTSLDDLAETVVKLKDNKNLYNHARDSILRFSEKYEIGSVYQSLISQLHELSSPQSFCFDHDEFRTPKSALTWPEINKHLANIELYEPPQSETLQQLKQVLTSVMTQAQAPYRLPSLQSAKAIEARPLSSDLFLQRYLSNYSSVLRHFKSIRDIDKGSHKSSLASVLSEINEDSCDPDEFLDILDTVQSVDDGESWKSIANQLRDWFNVAAVEQSQTDASIEGALVTALMAGRGMTTELLRFLLPSCQHIISEFVATNGQPPERLAKRWPWLNKLHLLLEQHLDQNINHDCGSLSWVTRHHFLVEEFMWTDRHTFLESCSLGLLKSGHAELSEAWQAQDDNILTRLIHVFRCYAEATLRQGYPIVLVFGFLADEQQDIWDDRVIKSCRIARLMIADSIRLQLASMHLRGRGGSDSLNQADIRARVLLRRLMRQRSGSEADVTPSQLTVGWLGEKFPGLSQCFIHPLVAQSFVELSSCIDNDD